MTCWRQQLERFAALLVICAENPPVTGESPQQRPVTRSYDVFFDLRLNKRLSKQSWRWWFETRYDVFFDLRLNKRLSKQSWRWWFETPSRSLWCCHNDVHWGEDRDAPATTVFVKDGLHWIPPPPPPPHYIHTHTHTYPQTPKGIVDASHD